MIALIILSEKPADCGACPLNSLGPIPALRGWQEGCPRFQLSSQSEGLFSLIVHELPCDDGQRQRQKEKRFGQ